MVLALSLSACSSSENKGPFTIDPPTAGVDSVAVALFVREPSGDLKLHWIGSPAGPLPESPEQTAVPWVGFGAPFELRWFIGSARSPVVGFRWKASQREGAPFVPAPIDSVPEWSRETRAVFANDEDPRDLAGANCPDGLDCPSRRRWESTFTDQPYGFQLEGRDQDGRVQPFEFGFHINYPPETRILRSGWPASPNGVEYPRYWYFDDSNNWVATHFAEGDTIPSGSYVVVAVEGTDRFASEVNADSFCCDLALGADAAILERQWRSQGAARDDRGQLREVLALWTPLAAIDTLGFFVGPLDYRLSARAVDEHTRRDPTPDTMDFVSGFPPRITSTVPSNGDAILIGPSGAVAASSRAVSVTPNVTRYWDTVLDRYWTMPLVDTQGVSGTVFVVPLRFESVPDPRQRGLVGEVAGRAFGGETLAWSYRYLSENDPENISREGDGDGDLKLFVAGNSGGLFVRTDAIEVFVPDPFWSQPDFYDPSGSCVIPEWCDQGRVLLRQLGRVDLDVVAKDTSNQSFLSTYPFSLRPDPGGSPVRYDLSELGRQSTRAQASFEVRLVLPGTPGEATLWPPRP